MYVFRRSLNSDSSFGACEVQVSDISDLESFGVLYGNNIKNSCVASSIWTGRKEMERRQMFAFMSMLLMSLLVGCTYEPTNGKRSENNTHAPEIEWHYGYGTDYEEHIHEGFQTSDGDYIGIGHTWQGQTEYTDMLVIKIDTNGNRQWQRIIGTSNQYDVGICVDEVCDGYIVGGALYSDGNQQRGLAKLDFNGNIVWQKTYANTGNGAIRGIDITSNGGIVATGYTNSPQQGFVFIADDGEGFIMKTDSDGNVQWDKTLSAPQGTKVREDINIGGFAVCSTVWVFDGADHQNVCLIKTDMQGNEVWSNTYGSSGNDQCFDFDLTSDGGYIFAGHTLSYGVSNWDYLLLKVGSDGNEQWHKTFGQPRGYEANYIHDESYGVRQTFDGSYIMVGGSGDEYSYSASGSPYGPSDVWVVYVVKTDGNGDLLWEGIYGSNSANDAGEYIALTNDGGYIVFVDTDSAGAMSPNNFGFMKLK